MGYNLGDTVEFVSLGPAPAEGHRAHQAFHLRLRRALPIGKEGGSPWPPKRHGEHCEFTVAPSGENRLRGERPSRMVFENLMGALAGKTLPLLKVTERWSGKILLRGPDQRQHPTALKNPPHEAGAFRET